MKGGRIRVVRVGELQVIEIREEKKKIFRCLQKGLETYKFHHDDDTGDDAVYIVSIPKELENDELTKQLKMFVKFFRKLNKEEIIVELYIDRKANFDTYIKKINALLNAPPSLSTSSKITPSTRRKQPLFGIVTPTGMMGGKK